MNVLKVMVIGWDDNILKSSKGAAQLCLRVWFQRKHTMLTAKGHNSTLAACGQWSAKYNIMPRLMLKIGWMYLSDQALWLQTGGTVGFVLHNWSSTQCIVVTHITIHFKQSCMRDAQRCLPPLYIVGTLPPYQTCEGLSLSTLTDKDQPKLVLLILDVLELGCLVIQSNLHVGRKVVDILFAWCTGIPHLVGAENLSSYCS